MQRIRSTCLQRAVRDRGGCLSQRSACARGAGKCSYGESEGLLWHIDPRVDFAGTELHVLDNQLDQ